MQIHNNLSLDHYLLADRPYLISWRLSKRDLPIYDLITLFQKYYKELDFCDLIRTYEAHYPMLSEERLLFFVLISIPEKIEFHGEEFSMCQVVQKFYDYLFFCFMFIMDYTQKEKVKS